MLIAVGDQRRERVHMVRVLYHWNLIRLGGGEEQREERERETILILVWGYFWPPALEAGGREELLNSGYSGGAKPRSHSENSVVL